MTGGARSGRLRRACPRRRREHGLTLIEMVVSLAVVALLTGFLIGGLHTAMRASDTDRRNELQVVTNAAIERLRDFVAAAVPFANINQSGILFRGQQEAIRFVALSEGRSLRGGLQEIVARRVGNELVVDVFGSPRDGHAGQSPASVVALRGVRELQFRYFGAGNAQGDAAWSNEWTDPERLPSLVSLGIVFEDQRRGTPPIVVALRNQAGR